MKVIRAPEEFLSQTLGIFSLFLAGSIEIGKAEDWQSRVERELAPYRGIILDPRRDDWDSSWVQSIKNDQFRRQVEWELLAQEEADTILMNFVAGMHSPIALLELGLFARGKKLLVVCPDGFWRKGNIEVVCKWYHVLLLDDLGEAIERLQSIARSCAQ